MSQTAEQRPRTLQLRLSSGHGPVMRTVLQTPPRDAHPSEVPIIDLSRLFSSHLADRQAVARDVRNAATNIGFFYVSNHGVPDATVQNAYETVLAFFRQDQVTKMKSAASAGPAKSEDRRSGYVPYAATRVNPDEGADHRESFVLPYNPRLDPALTDAGGPHPAHIESYLQEDDDHPWETTSHIPQFKHHLVSYVQAMLTLARALTRCFALSLNLPEDAFASKVQYPDEAMLFNYYPTREQPCVPADIPSQVSLGSHTDFRLFTILWQDHTGGLQVLNRQGQWINAPPVKGTFVVNIADLMQRITNDLYVSTVHRAHNWSGKERISIPFFFGFGEHETCSVLETCVDKQNPRKYDDVNGKEWVQSRLTQLMGGKVDACVMAAVGV